MTGAGLSREQAFARVGRMRDAYVEASTALMPTRVRLMPAVVERLEGLDARTDIALGLLTGNWERGAQSSSRLDLYGYFRFGGFGDDAIERDELPPVPWRERRTPSAAVSLRTRR